MAGEEITQIVSSDPMFFKLLLLSIVIGIIFTVVGGILNIILRVQEFLLYRELKQYDVITYKRFKSNVETNWWRRLFR